MSAYVYVMASESGTLYVGVTSNLQRRIQEHREGLVEGFTKKYGCKKLVYFEEGESILVAIAREKEIKGWKRCKKQALIKQVKSYLEGFICRAFWLASRFSLPSAVSTAPAVGV